MWSGRFKGLDTGCGDYEIPPQIWDQIAESWGFWYMYMAPILLKGHFQKEKYYTHMCKLSDLMKLMVQFEISKKEVDLLEVGLIEWVEHYEKLMVHRYYYQYEENQLPVCTLPIHGLLHIAAGICFCGPVWTSWTFYMEWYCGYLQAGLRSHRFPWSNLNKQVLHAVYLTQLKLKYNLDDELKDFHSSQHNYSVLKQNEKIYPDYPDHVMCSPYRIKHKPNSDTRHRISIYICTLIGGQIDQILPRLPEVMPLWGKLHIAAGGDVVRSAFAMKKSNTLSQCDNSFVRYEISYTVQEHRNTTVTATHYGHLKQILVCQLGNDDFWKDLSGRGLLLAIITPCKTEDNDASLGVAVYGGLAAAIATDICNIKAVVGQVKTRGRWGIIDRTSGLASVAFTHQDTEGVESEFYDSGPGSDDDFMQ
ncbi:hypothetical protein SERLADRAFT_412703 [Serpula lacrymans var. lacrymans S7.9]|uniref:Uncharacterized protein n=1 Tax=Serpula lacrymans var. lacrymans (strain S7.9) TaxID=578457 RepID=F8NIX5_SERL9|nr:uncharacterized protein SERLADRAFT_412703 [Serpula lacrymans var. lacrymans S7.9]EGO29008.1 hypothetical protein SERLADRAFT_412703 [Serpula lacrymans var. lacrymans S7.9]